MKKRAIILFTTLACSLVYSSVLQAQQDILDKLNIEALNPMQEEALLSITSIANTVLLSPTGTGKTVVAALDYRKFS